MRATPIVLILAAMNLTSADAQTLPKVKHIEMPSPAEAIKRSGACHPSYTDVEVEATAKAVQARRRAAIAAGASKVTDYAFVLDGVRYEMSFQQLKHALKTEQHRRHFGAHKPAMRTGDAS
ncbi:hypothetical protein [Burkholderia anthina]|uniref:hypothetical protein n=1 Tax=Burkholderia anthina TaxID=179879 RepID=UPI0015898C50|nr:hypothetical protein [Burkholderia anthina]